jgi:ferric-dicitrate binding protein FerR (iron transport regulator)
MLTCRPRSDSELGLGLLASVLLVCLAFLSGCQSCQRTGPLATLLGKSGEVVRDYQSTQNQWQAAPVGAEFAVGDAVRTQAKAAADLKLDDGSVLRLEADTLVRFLDRKPGSEEQAVDLVSGSATLEAGSEGTLLRTTVGSARLSGGGKMVLRRGDGAVLYKVLVGQAHVESAAGSMDVTAGQAVAISLGSAQLELSPDEKPEPEMPEEPAAPTGPIVAQIKGNTVSLTPAGEKASRRLKPGSATLGVGSLLVVGKGSRVDLSQGDQSATLNSEGRYVVGAGGHLVSVEKGSYTIRSERPVRIQVPGGVIVTSGGAALLRREAAATSITIESGTAELRGRNSETVVAGETGKLTDSGQATVGGRGLNYADLDLNAGNGLVVHDPAPPTAIRFHFAQKCGEGIVRLKGSKGAPAGDDVARGKDAVALAVGPGQVSYELTCVDAEGHIGAPVASGTVTVLADAGTKPVPQKAPSTFVDVNGRSYTVLYQNQLPQVTVRWSPPPDGVKSFKLHVSGGGRTRTLSSGQSSYTFGSGSLGEGSHTLYFEGGGRVSRKTSINLSFDNATPTVALQTPANTGVGPGGSLHLIGTALPGWSVAVDGRAIGLDADGRFSVSANMPGDGRPLGVYLTHPTRGSHVYLRRPAGKR